jgi:O-antigen/teichoic acid export membrane protein
MSVTVLANLIISIILVNICPNIHLIKFGAAIVFLIQPVAFNHFIERKFRGKNRKKVITEYTLKNRWDGFAQNLAHFINLNTDIAVITIFLSLIDVSVYSVYMLAITALRSIIASLTNSYQSVLGKYYAQQDYFKLKNSFDKFDNINTIISTSLFCTCILLINPFVYIYTKGITDANYYQPVFAVIIILANLVYCLREPYRFVILAAGKFRETNFGAILEAILNLGISVVLVRKMGLIGVAIGTLIAVSYRFFYFAFFLKKDILFKSYKSYVFKWVKILVLVAINLIIYWKVKINIDNFYNFLMYGIVIFTVETMLSYVLFIKIDFNRN